MSIVAGTLWKAPLVIVCCVPTSSFCFDIVETVTIPSSSRFERLFCILGSGKCAVVCFSFRASVRQYRSDERCEATASKGKRCISGVHGDSDVIALIRLCCACSVTSAVDVRQHGL